LRRAAQALFCALVPLTGFVLLAALTRQDYHKCIFDETLNFTSAIRPELDFFTHPLGIASMMPFALFAGLIFVRPSVPTFLLWIVATAVLLVPLCVADFHDCDRKGTDSYIWPLIAALPAFVIWLVALYLSNFRKAKT
jgi:hypothetical protein